jgi:membrane protein required for colicin V production
VLVDLLALAVLAVAALHGAAGGALRQLMQLGAAVVGWLAARHLAAPVAVGLGRWLPQLLARPAASALLFLGVFALATMAGSLVLRATRLAAVVKGPTDRGVGALIGGAKGLLAAWVLLSAAALAGQALPGRAGAELSTSELAGLARAHNLLARLDPERTRLVERLVRAVHEAQRPDARPADLAAARALLADPRLRALADKGSALEPDEAARLLEDPRVKELVERLGKGE